MNHKMFSFNAIEKKVPVQKMLRSIPSNIMSPERLLEERKISLELKARKSEVSKLYNERLASIATIESSRLPEAYREPVVEGNATIRLCSELDMDQLCCHYNEDFSLYAAGGADGLVRLYETTNFSLVRILSGGEDTQGFTSCVTCINHKPVLKSHSVNNQFTITYVNGIVKCFDYMSNICKFTINEGRQTYGLTFHPRMRKFITYGDDMKINLYDYETQTKEGIYQGSGTSQNHDGHTSRIFAAEFNPASNTEFLSGGWDTTVLLWDLRQPHAVRSISNVNLCGEGLDIDKTGRQILTCSWRKTHQLQLWDFSSFKLISTILPDTFDSKLYCGRFLGPDFIACGGGDPPLFRVIDRLTERSKVVISKLPNDVCHLNAGSIKYSASNKRRMKKQEEPDFRADLTRAPSVLLAVGGRIYCVEFY